jgi:hypothetical protein
MDNLEPWEVIAFIYNKSSGLDLDQEHFHFQRTAKMLAAIDNIDIENSFHTAVDLVNWNRKAIVAKIEVEKSLENDKEIIARGEQALAIINTLFPEYLLDN